MLLNSSKKKNTTNKNYSKKITLYNKIIINANTKTNKKNQTHNTATQMFKLVDNKKEKKNTRTDRRKK